MKKINWFLFLLTIMLVSHGSLIERESFETSDTYIEFLSNESNDVPTFDPIADFDFAEIDYGDLNGSKGRIWKDMSDPEQPVWHGIIELTKSPFETTKENSYDSKSAKIVWNTWDFNFDRDIKNLYQINIEHETKQFCYGWQTWLGCLGIKIPYSSGVLNINYDDHYVSENHPEHQFFNGYPKDREHNDYTYQKTSSNSYRLFTSAGLPQSVQNASIIAGRTNATVLSYEYILENDEVDDVMEIITNQLALELEELEKESLDLTEAHYNYRIEMLKQAYDYYEIEYDEKIFSVCTVNCKFAEFSYSLFDFIKAIFFFVVVILIIFVSFPLIKMVLTNVGQFIIEISKSAGTFVKRYNRILLIFVIWFLIDFFVGFDLVIVRILNNYRIDFKHYIIDHNIILKYLDDLFVQSYDNVDIITKYLKQEGL